MVPIGSFRWHLQINEDWERKNHAEGGRLFPLLHEFIIVLSIDIEYIATRSAVTPFDSKTTFES